ncbi:MAG TPA: sugar transferase, partial [Thermoanaerobaculia bacterium]|nr:sugar transferase [Thermoanaerobaculia bacterium]
EADDRTSYGSYWFDLRVRRPVAGRVKRLVDVIGALALIVALAPLILVLIVLIRLTSPGPAVFVQPRIGFRCNEFRMYKFRTMVADAARLQDELASASGSEFFKVRSDPRVTRLGRVLRKYSLDELPQLFNVLEGSMSLVGPRPLLPTDLQKFPLRGQMRRFSVRPGITGLWQVSGRSGTSDEERMRLDRDYVSHWTLWLDLKIVVKTLAAVLSGRGAV